MPEELEKNELPLDLQGWLPFAGFVIALPLYVFLMACGSFGRWAFASAVFVWVVFTGLFFWFLGGVVGSFLVGPLVFGYCSRWFIGGTLVLVAIEGIEILCRPYPRDGILGNCPGEPRMYLFDWWLPRKLANREFVLRVSQPATVVLIGCILGSQDPLFGTYLVVASGCIGLLNNWLFIKEKIARKGMEDVQTIGRSRLEAIGKRSLDDIESAGEVKILVSPIEITDSGPGRMPRAYQHLPKNIAAMLDWGRLKQIYGIEEDEKVMVRCQNCRRRIRVKQRILGRRVSCPGCAEMTVLQTADE